MVNLKIPIILGLLVVIIFVVCICINNKEGFTTLIGTTNNSLALKEDSISGVYENVDSIFATEKTYNYIPYNVNLIQKGENVIMMIDKVTPISRLGDLCSSNNECLSNKCDTTGSYNAKRRCVKPDASTTKTGDENTIPSVKTYMIFYIKSGNLYRYNSNKKSSTKYISNVSEISIGNAYVCFYKTNNNQIWRIEINKDNENKSTKIKLGSNVTSNISAISKDFIYWAANSNRQLYRWQNGSNQTGGLTSYNVKTVAGVNGSCVWYISNDSDHHLGKNVWTSSTGWKDYSYTGWHTLAEISPVSADECYYRCNGTTSTNSYKGCWKDDTPRALSHQISGSGHSVENCITQCSNKGYKYSGRQYNGQCFCGNSDSTTDGYKRYGEGTGCDCNGDNVGSWKQCVYEKSTFSCSNTIYKVDTNSNTITEINGASGATKISTIDSNSFYFVKDGNLRKYSNKTITSYPANSVHKWSVANTNELFLISNSSNDLLYMKGSDIVSYPLSSQLSGLSDVQASITYVVNLPSGLLSRNNKKNFQGHMLIYGKIKRRLNGKKYITILTEPVYKKI
jgi:hypothetical protein